MNQDLLKSLPLDISIDVLLRLPVQSIARCKCVCKSWLRLLRSDEFFKAHLSKSVPALFVYNAPVNLYRVFDLGDGFNHQCHEPQHKPITHFNLPHYNLMYGSSDGLLFFHDHNLSPHEVYICNPITRDWIEVHCPRELFYSNFCGTNHFRVTYGFGKSKVTGQHKVVGISQGYVKLSLKSEYRVYTLGTGLWRKAAPGPKFKCWDGMVCLDGNLHWLVDEDNFSANNTALITCFNLDTELFSTFRTPNNRGNFAAVCALGDCLCLCEDARDKVSIWFMKEYGVDKSWTREIVLRKTAFTCSRVKAKGFPYPLKVCRDGGILLAWRYYETIIFHYSKEDESARRIGISEADTILDAILYTPSFLSLKSFATREKVCSF